MRPRTRGVRCPDGQTAAAGCLGVAHPRALCPGSHAVSPCCQWMLRPGSPPQEGDGLRGEEAVAGHQPAALRDQAGGTSLSSSPVPSAHHSPPRVPRTVSPQHCHLAGDGWCEPGVPPPAPLCALLARPICVTPRRPCLLLISVVSTLRATTVGHVLSRRLSLLLCSLRISPPASPSPPPDLPPSSCSPRSPPSMLFLGMAWGLEDEGGMA